MSDSNNNAGSTLRIALVEAAATGGEALVARG
jgi:hypothetical protein